MEPIVVGGLVIVAFGIWVEFEPFFQKLGQLLGRGAAAVRAWRVRQEQCSGMALNSYRPYRSGSHLPYRLARS